MTLERRPSDRELARMYEQRTGQKVPELAPPRMPSTSSRREELDPLQYPTWPQSAERATPLTFYLPEPPDNANSRLHWAIAFKRQRALVEQLRRRFVAGYGFPPPPVVPIEFAELQATWHYADGRSHIDPTNIQRRLKPVEDFLVTVGYLAGDTENHVRWLPAKSATGYENMPPLCTVELIVTPIPEAG